VFRVRARASPAQAVFGGMFARGAEPPFELASVRFLRLLIWLATLFFAIMLFLPIVREMVRRLGESGSGLP
jgi:hypothetical protein